MLPFSKSNQLVCDLEPDRTAEPEQATVPGQPLLALHDSAGVDKLLASELYAQDLETMARRLWIMTTFSSANINSLHRQRVKGREILITEDPRLHLVWDHNRIFIKPIPRCLLSHEFWRIYLHKSSDRLGDSRERLQRVALGFLRTYRYLIQYESDLRIAQQANLCLVPQGVDWPSFCRFASGLANIEDADVSGRYCYGELRLTRLNIYAPVLLRKFHYEQIHGQYSDFFGRMFGPVLFVFAIVSVILNSMQVELVVEQLTAAQWSSFWMASRWFSILSLGGAGIIAAWLVLLWLWVFLDEWVYTIRRKRGKRWIYHGQPPC